MEVIRKPVLRVGQPWAAGQAAAKRSPKATDAQRIRMWAEYTNDFAKLGPDADMVHGSAFHAGFNAQVLSQKRS